MSSTAEDQSLDIEDIRDRILCDPEIILDDRDVMKALIAANLERTGKNIIDLRGITMDRLETNLDRLEDTHRSVVTAAYENLAGTKQIHRALLPLLEAGSFPDMLAALKGEAAEILRVDAVAMVVESSGEERAGVDLEGFPDLLLVREPGFCDGYIDGGCGTPPRTVTLRAVADASRDVFGGRAGNIRSEAALRLDFGEDRPPGLLILGAEDMHQFRAAQGTDLLEFFAGAFGRLARRWLS